jgi:hypothetical protein
MTYKAYIHKTGRFPSDEWGMSAYYGFQQKKTKVVLFSDLDKVPLSRYNIIVAGTEYTIKRIKDLGIEPPQALHIPEELNQYLYLGRCISHMTFKMFKGLAERDSINFPIFIKPEGYAKEFVAGPVSNRENALLFYDNVPDDCLIMLSEIVDIVSEYRCYVLNGELIGIKHYLGDIRIFPDVRDIDNMIATYRSQPKAFALDVGITNRGNTILIECNDAWSLGNYGLNDKQYAHMLAVRWHEMMSKKVQ